MSTKTKTKVKSPIEAIRNTIAARIDAINEHRTAFEGKLTLDDLEEISGASRTKIGKIMAKVDAGYDYRTILDLFASLGMAVQVVDVEDAKATAERIRS